MEINQHRSITSTRRPQTNTNNSTVWHFQIYLRPRIDHRQQSQIKVYQDGPTRFFIASGYRSTANFVFCYRPNYFATVCQQDLLFEVNRILCYSFFSSNCALFLLFYDSKTVGVILSYGCVDVFSLQTVFFHNNISF